MTIQNKTDNEWGDALYKYHYDEMNCDTMKESNHITIEIKDDITFDDPLGFCVTNKNKTPKKKRIESTAKTLAMFLSVIGIFLVVINSFIMLFVIDNGFFPEFAIGFIRGLWLIMFACLIESIFDNYDKEKEKRMNMTQYYTDDAFSEMVEDAKKLVKSLDEMKQNNDLRYTDNVKRLHEDYKKFLDEIDSEEN